MSHYLIKFMAEFIILREKNNSFFIITFVRVYFIRLSDNSLRVNTHLYNFFSNSGAINTHYTVLITLPPFIFNLNKNKGRGMSLSNYCLFLWLDQIILGTVQRLSIMEKNLLPLPYIFLIKIKEKEGEWYQYSTGHLLESSTCLGVCSYKKSLHNRHQYLHKQTRNKDDNIHKSKALKGQDKRTLTLV